MPVSPKPSTLDLAAEDLDAVLDRVAALLYADVRPVLAQRQRDRTAEARVVGTAGNVIRLDERRGRRGGRVRLAS